MHQALKCLILVCVLLVFAPPAQAARFTGNYLLQMCGSDAKGNELVKGGHGICQAYISGVIDYYSFVRSMGQGAGIDFCIPPGTSFTTLQNIVSNYLLKNKAEHGSFIASPAVALALYSSYPCRTAKKKK
jgi:hypothetical protein